MAFASGACIFIWWPIFSVTTWPSIFDCSLLAGKEQHHPQQKQQGQGPQHPQSLDMMPAQPGKFMIPYWPSPKCMYCVLAIGSFPTVFVMAVSPRQRWATFFATTAASIFMFSMWAFVQVVPHPTANMESSLVLCSISLVMTRPFFGGSSNRGTNEPSLCSAEKWNVEVRFNLRFRCQRDRDWVEGWLLPFAAVRNHRDIKLLEITVGFHTGSSGPSRHGLAARGDHGYLRLRVEGAEFAHHVTSNGPATSDEDRFCRLDPVSPSPDKR